MGYLPYSQGGTWTPVITGAGTAGTGTYTSQVGTYQLIGNMVFVQFEVTWTAHDGTGNMTLTGFPFDVANVAGYDPEATVACSNLVFPASTTFLEAHILPNTSVLLLFCAGDSVAASALQMDSAGALHGAITYRKNA